MEYIRQCSEAKDLIPNDFVKVGMRQILADKYIDVENKISSLNLQLKGKISLFDLFRSEIEQIDTFFKLDDELTVLKVEFLQNEIKKKNEFTRINGDLNGFLSSLQTDIGYLIECENQDAYQEYKKKLPDVIKNAEETEIEVSKLLQKSSPLNFRQYLHQESSWLLDLNFYKNYNEIFKNITSIAVLGRRGAGKSSFINALRNIHSFDEDAAVTGVIECTLENKCYQLRTNELADGTDIASKKQKEIIYIWDFPGVGTEKFPSSEYQKLISSIHIDVIIYAFYPDFGELDETILNAIKKTKINYILIRNKIDLDFDMDELNEEEINKLINKDWIEMKPIYETKYRKILADEKIFFLSSNYEYKDHFDFYPFIQHLLKLVSENKSNFLKKFFKRTFKSLNFKLF
jgi:GTP-binding protein EngB required for normal cell division